MHCLIEWPRILPWYVQVALVLYHFGKGGWWILPGDIIAIWLATRDGKRSSYVIGIRARASRGWSWMALKIDLEKAYERLKLDSVKDTL